MSKTFIVHIGTGTIIDVEDNTVFIELNDEQVKPFDQEAVLEHANLHGVDVSEFLQAVDDTIRAYDKLKNKE